MVVEPAMNERARRDESESLCVKFLEDLVGQGELLQSMERSIDRLGAELETAERRLKRKERSPFRFVRRWLTLKKNNNHNQFLPVDLTDFADDLHRMMMRPWISYPGQLRNVAVDIETAIRTQNETIERLKTKLRNSRDKLSDLLKRAAAQFC